MKMIRCQCRAFEGKPGFSCASLATQEDLLCDSCRESRGCCAGLEDRHHFMITGWSISLGGRPLMLSRGTLRATGSS